MTEVENKKYELIETADLIMFTKMFRIRALRSFGDVKEGQLGGYVESENNLSHEGNAWIYHFAKVCGNAKVIDNAKIRNRATVLFNAVVSENAEVYDNAVITDDAVVEGDTKVYGDARVGGVSKVTNTSKVHGNANVDGNAFIFGNAEVGEDSTIDNGYIFENAKVYDNAIISGPGAIVAGNVKVCEDCHIVTGTTVTGDNVLTSYRDFVNFKNPYSYNAYTWVKNSNKIYRNDNGLFLFWATNPNETIEQFREAEKARSFNPDIAEKAIKALDAFLEMTEKLAEIK